MSNTIESSAATTTPIKVNKLGHLVYEVSDIERSTKWWTDIMGFSVSDTNDLGMIFLRSAGDHHSIALVPSKHKSRPPAEAGLRFNHLAMEVDNIDVLLNAKAFLEARGIPVVYEGRRGPGGNIGIEFEDPDGYIFEIYCGMDQVGPDGRTRPAEQFNRQPTLAGAIAEPLPESW